MSRRDFYSALNAKQIQIQFFLESRNPRAALHKDTLKGADLEICYITPYVRLISKFRLFHRKVKLFITVFQSIPKTRSVNSSDKNWSLGIFYIAKISLSDNVVMTDSLSQSQRHDYIRISSELKEKVLSLEFFSPDNHIFLRNLQDFLRKFLSFLSYNFSKKGNCAKY